MAPINFFRNTDATMELPAGAVLFNQGDAGNEMMYAVKEGELEIIMNGVVLETVVEGGFFGEMSLVDSSPRAASAVAKTDCKLIEIDRHAFLFKVQEAPRFALSVMHVMAERIRKLHQQI